MPQPTQSLRVPLVGAAAAALLTLGMTLQSRFYEAPTVGSSATQTDAKSATDKSPVSVHTSSTANDPLHRQVRYARFFDQSVTPLIEQTDAENLEAAKRCLSRLDQVIQSYHAGVEPFVHDMTSLGTRFGILKRMPGGWWKGDARVEAYVQDKFETHLFTEQQLIDDISEVLLQFRCEIDANQTALLASVQAALTTADLPEVALDNHETFFRELSKELNVYVADQGTTSVQNMIGALILGEVGAFAARSVITGLLARFAPSVAISSAAGASATVGASATGAGGGSLGGPVGVVVGFGAGLAVGLVIDWWMTEQFESKLTEQLHLYLNDLQETLVSGGQASVADGEHYQGYSVGLEEALPDVCRQLSKAYRDRFFTQIVDGESS